MSGWGSFSDFLRDALAKPADQRQPLVDTLLAERPAFPWIEGDEATFIYARHGTERVAVNLDRIQADPPFVPLERLEGTNLFYRTMSFAMDDLLDYMMAVNDPMTPLAQERDIVGRVRRYWKPDPHNPASLESPQADVSVLRMPHARPFPDWSRMRDVPRGTTSEHTINSQQLGMSGRKVWVHVPANYGTSNLDYPLLILQDGQWAIGPLQVPHIVDALIKHGRMAPVIVAMVQSGSQQDRISEYVTSGKYYPFVLTELVPLLQSQYRIDATDLSIGGVSAGGIAGANAALKNPAVFSGLLMLSPPMGTGPAQNELMAIPKRMTDARMLPRRIFHTVGRYESQARFVRPSHQLADILSERDDVEYQFVELGSGHGLIAFRSILPEALAWMYPGWASL